MSADYHIETVVKYQPFYKSFNTIEEAIADAEIVLEVVPNGDREYVVWDQFGYPNANGYTVTNVHVQKIIKDSSSYGDMNLQESIPITEPYYLYDNGIAPGKTMKTYANYTPLKNGGKYIILLKWDPRADLYGISSLHEGKYNLDHTDSEEDEVNSTSPNYLKLKREILNTFQT